MERTVDALTSTLESVPRVARCALTLGFVIQTLWGSGRGEAVAALAAAAEGLRNVVQQIDIVTRERDEAYVAKKRHLDEHDLLYVYVARTFESMCQLAGESELAERVRRTVPRRNSDGEGLASQTRPIGR